MLKAVTYFSRVQRSLYTLEEHKKRKPIRNHRLAHGTHLWCSHKQLYEWMRETHVDTHHGVDDQCHIALIDLRQSTAEVRYPRHDLRAHVIRRDLFVEVVTVAAYPLGKQRIVRIVLFRRWMFPKRFPLHEQRPSWVRIALARKILGHNKNIFFCGLLLAHKNDDTQKSRLMTYVLLSNSSGIISAHKERPPYVRLSLVLCVA